MRVHKSSAPPEVCKRCGGDGRIIFKVMRPPATHEEASAALANPLGWTAVLPCPECLPASARHLLDEGELNDAAMTILKLLGGGIMYAGLSPSAERKAAAFAHNLIASEISSSNPAN